MRLAHTGLCVGEGTEKFVPDERIVLGQQDCATASPPMSVEAVEGGYRLLLHSPDNGEGCVTVDYGGTNAEVLLAGDNCEPGRPDQRFTFEPVTAPTPGYLLKSAAGAKWCIGVYQGSSETGVQLIQGRCVGGPHQVFLVEAA
ncbi:RICIN domain-containing protein [Amycolatopsis sp. SID8362]|uniref:RICIN domain-containing protein n=1 Tax=Amycolatopsis sp. SID8362 TaxID=2690346 RepID=UPI00194124DF|nr:RICIN domain-containing protein [Amycolatopsis sp. SID8362]